MLLPVTGHGTDPLRVRVTDDIGTVLGTDGVEYNLQAGDTVDLPAATAAPLLERDAAEPLEDRCASRREARAVARDDPDVGVVDPETYTADEASAAAFMGGDSAFASDDDPDSSPDFSATETRYERTVSALPIAQLDALSPEKRRRAARKRGLSWPTTDEARDQLFDTLADTLRHEDDRIVDASTSLGKSYTVASARWGAREDLTGGRPVVHLSATRNARDEAAQAANEDGGEYIRLRSRHEACPIAAGDHDPEAAAEDDRIVVTVNGEPASEWIDGMCNTEGGKGLPFSVAHRHLETHNDQGLDTLPCRADGGCEAIQQYERLREGDHPLVIATHNFAHIPGLRTRTNVVIDEEPDFSVDLSTDRVRRAVSAYLREIEAPVSTWEAFIQLARHDGRTGDAAVEREALQSALDTEPSRDWYLEHPDAHTLAPALARAVFHAEARPNGRRFGKSPHQPPRLDADARESEGWNREWVSVVLDDTNEVRSVRTVPDLSAARSVVGLDAHPALPVWQANTLPWIQSTAVLTGEARQLWRRYERGLRVVQVGDATRPLTSGEYFDGRGVQAVAEHLRDEYGADFRTAITAKSVEERLENELKHAGVDSPDLMHYGDVKSRNDFDGESVGLVNGCIDPGDGPILDLVAELGLDAEPKRADAPCEHCGAPDEAPETAGDGCPECNGTGWKRAHGREFVGEDADTAQSILAAVRENQVAQAAGRYARAPDDPEDTATVFVRTDATPPEFADVHVPGVEWVYTDTQEEVVEVLRDCERPTSTLDVADEADVSKRHVHRTLKRLADHGTVQAFEGAGRNGATLYAESGLPNSGVVDLTDEDGEVVTDHVRAPYTWSVTIANPDDLREASAADPPDQPAPSDRLFRWTDDAVEGDSPPNVE